MAAETQQSVDSERRVADPREPVVPVAVTAECFRKRSGGSGGDGARRRVQQQLERERRAHDFFTPRTVVGQLRRPLAPERDGHFQAAFDCCARRDDQQLLVRRDQRNEGRAPGSCFEAACDGVCLAAWFSRFPRAHGDGVSAGGRDGHAQSCADAGSGGGVAEARLERPLHRDDAGQRLDTAGELARWG